ncbi:tail length tape measure protein [Vibrio phage 166E36-1]
MQTLAKFVNKVRWESDAASFKKIKKDINDVKKGMKAPTKALETSQKKSLAYANQRYKIDKSIEKREKAEINRADKLHKLKQKQVKAQQSLQSAQIKQTMSGMTQGTGAGRASDTVFADKLRQEERLHKLKQKQVKAQQSLQSAQIKQTMSGMTQGTGAGRASDTVFADKLRQEERLQQRINSILKKDMFYREGISDEMREMYRTQLKSAKSEEDLLKTSRNIRGSVRDINREYDRSIKKTRQQHFMLQRMESSTKQIAGNMVSAFAALGAGAYVIQTGAAFESVNSTMLAVSEDSKQAGENLAFVREEARRLGLSLTESSKGFAKLAAARGDISLEDTKQVFSAVSEMSTLLGLTADESNRALIAINQMASKGIVQAEELDFRLAA